MKIAFFFLITTGLTTGFLNHTSHQKVSGACVAISISAPSLSDTVNDRMNDTQFLISAYNTGMYEVKAAKLARRQTGARRVRKFAVASMVSQDTMNKNIMALLTIKGIAIPEQVPSGLKAGFEDLNSWMGKEFNDKYLAASIETNKGSVALYRLMSVNSKDADVRHFAKDAAARAQVMVDSASSLLKYIDRPVTSTW